MNASLFRITSVAIFGICFLIPTLSGCAQVKSLLWTKTDDVLSDESEFEDDAFDKDFKLGGGSKSTGKEIVLDTEKKARKLKGENAVENAANVTLDDARRAEVLGQPQEAEKLYRQFIQQNTPDNKPDKKPPEEVAYAYRQLAIFRAQRQEYGASEAMFQKSLELSPNDPVTAGTYAQSLRDQKKYAEAERVVRDCIKNNPSDERLQCLLGQSLIYQKRYSEGLRYLKKAIGEPQAYQELAKVLYYNHDDPAAAELAMKKLDGYYAARGLVSPRPTTVAVAPNLSPFSTPISPPVTYPGTSPYSAPVQSSRQIPPPQQITTNQNQVVPLQTPQPTIAKPMNPIVQQPKSRDVEVPEILVTVPTNPEVIVKMK